MNKKITITLALVMVLLGSYLKAQSNSLYFTKSEQSKIDSIYESQVKENLSNTGAFFEGFTVSILGGVRSEAMKIDGVRLGTTGFKTTLQGQGVSVKDYFGYTFGLQVSYSTVNYYRPPSDLVSSININVRNYEFNTFFAFTDQTHNMFGFFIGGGKADTRKYRGYWAGGLIGALNLPIMNESLYLGLQTQAGLKTNQLELNSSNLFVELLICVTKRL